MRSKIKAYLGDESGNTAIESVFAVTICIFAVCVLIMFGFLFYQESLLMTTASKVSSSIARTYKRQDLDPFIGYIEADDLSYSMNENLYYVKELFGSNSYSEKKESLAEWYAEANLNKYRFMSCELGSQMIEADVRVSKLVAYQDEIVVTVKESYTIPLLKLLGVSDTGIVFQGKAVSLCTDMSGFYSLDNFLLPYLSKELESIKAVKAGEEVAVEALELAEKIVGTMSEIFDTLSGIDGDLGSR